MLWLQIQKAKYWYEKAAELGDGTAAYALGTLYENLHYDTEGALKWYV